MDKPPAPLPESGFAPEVISMEKAVKNAPKHEIPVHFSQFAAILRPEIQWPPKLDGTKWQ